MRNVTQSRQWHGVIAVLKTEGRKQTGETEPINVGWRSMATLAIQAVCESRNNGKGIAVRPV